MEGSFKIQPKGFSTKSIHLGRNDDNWHTAIVPPIFTSTIFKHISPGVINKYRYGRFGNPSANVLEQKLAGLSNAKYSLSLSSGLGAITHIFTMFGSGDHIIISDTVYYDAYNLFTKVMSRFGIDFDFVDMTKLENLKKFIKPNTKMIWIETPSYPTFKLIDIAAVSNVAHKYPKLIVIVDNTMLTPYFQQPLELGADMVVYSLSKYINGHSDVIMGALVTNSEEIYTELKTRQSLTGIIPSPMDCSQVCRSICTLKLRMEQHYSNALNVAKYLETNQFVERVLHPGLKSHPQHKLAMQQSYGHSGVLSFFIKGNHETAKKFLKSLKIMTLTESYGGFESFVSLPILTDLDDNVKAKLCITDTLITLSVGLEDFQDIIDDLEQALKYSHIQ